MLTISQLSKRFPAYDEHSPCVPVRVVTPGRGGCIHRFFDTSPLSPSGRYLGLIRFPCEDRLPRPGESAEILLVDLVSGEERIVGVSRGWDTQLGAQVQWGADDHHLFFNDLVPGEWRPFGVCMDPLSGERRRLDGPVYMVSPDGRQAVNVCLRRIGHVQPGYGVLVPPEHLPANDAAPDDDGVWITDTHGGTTRLAISWREIVERLPQEFDVDLAGAPCGFYGFHVKWNPQADRLMLVLVQVARTPKAPRRRRVLTLKPDGSDLRVAIPVREWMKGAHHPNWCPDGQSVLVNLNISGQGLRFVRAGADGSGLRAMHDAVLGSGHPTLHPDGRHVLTDAYLHEVAFAREDGSVPIRWVDTATGQETCLLRVPLRGVAEGPARALRVDAHPAWSRDYRWLVFNGVLGGQRRVFLADMSRLKDGIPG